MPGLLLLASLAAVLCGVHSTRCYMCRDVEHKSGNRRMFAERSDAMQQFGWIAPCSDDTFVVYPQVECVQRVYITYELCFPSKKCTVKVTERFPVLPGVFTQGQAFFARPFAEDNLKDEKTCSGDLCNGNYKNKHKDGLKCYHQCGKINLFGMTARELDNYDLPVIPCDSSTYNYCDAGMECGYIVGSATYTDVKLSKDITVVGWYADCFNVDNDDISHVLQTVSVMMRDHPSLQITGNDLTKCGRELCNYID